MEIERDAHIRFHELGTLSAVTRWVASHDEGVAEWLKNARRAYQHDRAGVGEPHRVCLLLLRDASAGKPARIGLLDVGGATLEDVSRWSTWQDPEASGRGSESPEEETQGNGGKAYMYRMFRGPARLLGIRDGRLNCKGFEGPHDSLDRGTPGFVPSVVGGRDLEAPSWEASLNQALAPYDVAINELPTQMNAALHERRAFTLVEGVDPVGVYKGRIDSEDLVHKLLRHDQATLAVQQLQLYSIHNGYVMNEGKPLQLEAIPPCPGFEQPRVHEIPEVLPDASGVLQSTTLNGQRPKGRLVLHTSHANMHRAYKELRPRWKVTYRTEYQMVGSKSIAELVTAVPGSQYVYATVELSALEPDYVALGRVRPIDGPLIEAVDRYTADKIRDLAKEIHERRRHEFDQEQLDAIHEENRQLDNFKNRFLPSYSIGESTAGVRETRGRGFERERGGGGDERGTVPDSVEFVWKQTDTLRLGNGVRLHMAPILQPRVLDGSGRTVPQSQVVLEWHSADRRVVEFESGDHVEARGKGATEIWACVSETMIESSRINVEVWNVDHVLLTPRTLEIPLGKTKQITAEVTNDDGARAVNVFLNWEHDAADPLIVRIHPTGKVTGNRVGRTSISAGAGASTADGVWARIRAEVTVVENPDELRRGGGFPRLLLTGRDIDPTTGEIRQGDPEQPALWQEPIDYVNNVWWLNLESPAALFFFNRRDENPDLWRSFHSQQIVTLVLQIHMQEEFSSKGSEERKDLWASHKAAAERHEVQLTPAMWDQLSRYVLTGGGLD